MEGKPDWLSGFPVQIYCNRSDRIYLPQLPLLRLLAYKADNRKKNNEKGGQPESCPPETGRQIVPAFVCL